MEQPFINQDPNAIDSTNHIVQGNIYATDNQIPNQAQMPSNPGYMMPPNMNPPQAQQPPEQPYYQPQAQNITYDKPLNSQNNQIPPPSQPYPQNAIPIQPQPVYPPQGVPQTNYPPQYPPQVGPVQVQPVQPVQPVYNPAYKNYNNISQIRHRGIKQPDENTFYISSSCCYIIFPLMFCGVGIFLMTFPITKIGEGKDIPCVIAGVIFFIIGIYLFCSTNNSVYFIMGPNTLTIMKKGYCRKKTRTYNPGELQRIAFDYHYEYRGSGKSGGYKHIYSIIVYPTRESVDNAYSDSGRSPLFTAEEIDYFLYHINTHIQTKMSA